MSRTTPRDLREAVALLLGYAEQRAEAAVAKFTAGGLLDRGTPNAVGATPVSGGGTGHTGGAEPPLGNPDGDYYVLVSTAAGVRSWAQLIAGPGITIERNSLTGALTISVTDSLQGLTWGGDDLTWGGNIITWGMA